MFWRLGVKLARRGLNRNALAVVSIAVTTLMLSFGLDIGRGRPGILALAARQYLGGDILVHAPALALPGLPLGSGQSWAWQPPDLNRTGPLGRLSPTLLWYGAPAGPSTLAAVRHTAAVLASFPGVAQTLPYDALPALWSYAPGRQALVEVVARNPADDRATGFATQDVIAGRYFAAGQGNSPVALVDGFRPDLTGARARAQGYDRDNGRLVAMELGRPVQLAASPPAVGSALHLQLPRWHGGAPDYSRLTSTTLHVVGQYQVRDGTWNWKFDALHLDGLSTLPAQAVRQHEEVEPADWSTGAVLVPAAYWQALARQVDWSPPAASGTWLLRLQGGLGAVNQVTNALRAALPGATVAEVSTLAAASRFQRDPALAVPKSDAAMARSTAAHQLPTAGAAPGWAATASTWVAFLIAALVYAGNLYVVLINRRREIAALRAAGATVGQVVTMLAAETGVVAATGAAAGVLLSLPIITWQTLSNSLGVGGVALAWLRLLAVVCGGTLPLLAIALALAGNWVARLRPLEVMRGA